MSDTVLGIAQKLFDSADATDAELLTLLRTDAADELLSLLARRRREEVYGKDVYLRALIEISSYCRNDCFYCGIRAGNRNAKRYRLSPDEIMECCHHGYSIGFRTFVLQGGEDAAFDEETLVRLIDRIKVAYPDCALTLSVGEWSRESYRRFYDAGADRYLLRHETATESHYRMLHPERMSFSNRMRCLYDLKDIGYQVGCGFMVGSPWQTEKHLVCDLRFIKNFAPQMIGIGPFLPHCDTPFADKSGGSVEMTLRLLSILRLMNPSALLPATTALGTASADGRSRGILAGANVIMPNVSPKEAREKYMLYNNKLNTGAESAEGLRLLEDSMSAIGYRIVSSRGDCSGFVGKEAQIGDRASAQS